MFRTISSVPDLLKKNQKKLPEMITLIKKLSNEINNDEKLKL